MLLIYFLWLLLGIDPTIFTVVQPRIQRAGPPQGAYQVMPVVAVRGRTGVDRVAF